MLPLVMFYALLIWLLGGLITQRLWIQLAGFAVSVYLMVELNNSNALLRIRSRLVSGAFVALYCTACFLFSSLNGAFMQAGVIASLLLLFHTYQDPSSAGKIYYGFLFWSLSSLLFPQLLFFVPLLWILMGTQLLSLSVRTFMASILGIVTPYWFAVARCLYLRDFSWLSDHFQSLFNWDSPVTLGSLPIGHLAVFLFIVVLSVISMVHLWQYSYEDKIRIRLVFGFFKIMLVVSIFYLLLQPQHFDAILRIIIIMASPIIAHFFVLTSNRVTNILFLVSIALVVIITVFNLWMPSLTF